MRGSKLFKTEDYWAIWVGMLVIAVATVFFFSGSSIKGFAVTPGQWDSLAELGEDIAMHLPGYVAIYLGFGAIFSISMATMGHSLKHFIPGYTLIFLGSLAVFYSSSTSLMKEWHLGAPLLALLIGLIIGNLKKLPAWFHTALRTEYYIKIGIVLLGATLPLTLIFRAGPVAFLQGTVVCLATWFTIFLAATRIFNLDPKFGAVLGAGGAVCGVSASIAVGGAVKAERDHIAISIGVVSIWAVVMIFVLALAAKPMIAPTPQEAASPLRITAGEAGAWVGTSQYADAAGFAVVAEIAEVHGDAPIRSFTLIKVLGRDIWIGIWAFLLSIVSAMFWDKSRTEGGSGPGAKVIWDRLPKFVVGFLVASVIMTLAATLRPADHVGTVPFTGAFKSKTEKVEYEADFTVFEVPEAVRDKFVIDMEGHTIAFKGKMTHDELDLLQSAAKTQDQKVALKRLHYKSDWFESVLKPKAISPIKKLRSWCFVFCFLCIGLSTRFKDLATFGMKPFYAFTAGVIVNFPLGYLLSTVVFSDYWRAIR